MLGLASDQEIERIRLIFKRYASDMSDDLESLIFLGRMEMKMPPPSDALR